VEDKWFYKKTKEPAKTKKNWGYKKKKTINWVRVGGKKKERGGGWKKSKERSKNQLMGGCVQKQMRPDIMLKTKLGKAERGGKGGGGAGGGVCLGTFGKGM